MAYTEEQKLKAWAKARTVEGFNPDQYRKDACGAWMIWDKYGAQDNIYGWEIDHIVPRSLLEDRGFAKDEINRPENLRALQYRNNASKSDDYPSYTAVVTAENNKNIEEEHNLVVNAKLRERLSQIYNL